MPYIKKTDRVKHDEILRDIDYSKLDMGDINYFVSSMLKMYIEVHGESYSNYNSLIGVVESIKLELYRRQVSPYEDVKIGQNGDI